MASPDAGVATPPEARGADIRAESAELLRLAGPVVISRLGIMTMGLCDAVVVGRFSARELGYHSLGWAPTAVALTVSLGLLMGVQVMTARYIGEGRRHEAGAVLRRGLVYGLWIGIAAAAIMIGLGPLFLNSIGLEPDLARGAAEVLIIFSLSLPFTTMSVAGSSWLEALSKPGVVSWIMWIGNVINLGLLLLLVPGTFGLPAMGAIGGGWATFGARAGLAILTLAYIWRWAEARGLGVFDKPRSDRADEREQRRIGYGAGASNFFEVAAFAGMNVVAGWIGVLAVASWAVVVNVASVVFMVPLGLATATTVLVGRAYGARDLPGVRRAGMIGFAAAAVFGLVVSLAIWPTAELIAKGYTTDPAAIALAVPALVLSCVFFLPDALQVVIAHALRARADVLAPTITHMISYALIMTPLSWWFAIPMGYGLIGIVWGVIVASFAAFGFLGARWLWLARRL